MFNLSIKYSFIFFACFLATTAFSQKLEFKKTSNGILLEENHQPALVNCKGIVEAHGGTIWVADVPSGTTISPAW